MKTWEWKWITIVWDTVTIKRRVIVKERCCVHVRYHVDRRPPVVQCSACSTVKSSCTMGLHACAEGLLLQKSFNKQRIVSHEGVYYIHFFASVVDSFIHSFIHTYSNVDNKNAVTNNYTIWSDCTKCKHKISNMKILFIIEEEKKNIEEEKKRGFYSSPLNHKRDNVQVTGQIQRTTFNNNIGRRSDQISKLINIIEQIKFKLFCKRLKRDTLLRDLQQRSGPPTKCHACSPRICTVALLIC